MMDRRGPVEAVACVLGIGLTVAVSMGQVSSGGEEPALWLVFGGGAVAIAAMILPGISGSFVLLVLGLYQATLEHIHHITARSFVFLGVMAAGFFFGVVTISRAMSWLLKHQRSATLAFLIGLIFGSFYVLWPFKDYDAPLETPAVAAAARAPASLPGASWTSGAAQSPAAPSQGEAPKQKISIRVATAPNRLPRSVGEVAWPALMLLLGLGCASGLNRLGRTGASEAESKPSKEQDAPDEEAADDAPDSDD
jgi:putative membrane protein